MADSLMQGHQTDSTKGHMAAGFYSNQAMAAWSEERDHKWSLKTAGHLCSVCSCTTESIHHCLPRWSVYLYRRCKKLPDTPPAWSYGGTPCAAAGGRPVKAEQSLRAPQPSKIPGICCNSICCCNYSAYYVNKTLQIWTMPCCFNEWPTVINKK